MTLEYKVPRILWENLESVLLAQSKRYIGELAKRLHVSEKDLLKKVLPTNDSLKVIIQDSQQETNQCTAYVQEGQLTVHCRKPVAYQSQFCPIHRNHRMMVMEGTHPTPIQKVKDNPQLPPMWQNHCTLINSKGEMIGKINHAEQTMTLFVIEECLNQHKE
jgi:hypothetical protein